MLTRPNRIALHMVDATATDLPRTRQRRPLPIWRWWMSLAAIVLLSAVVAVIVVRILRWAL